MRTLRATTMLVGLCLTTSALCAGEKAVAIDVGENTAEVTIGGEPFAVYNFGKDLPKPFFSPVRGPGGVVLTRPILAKGEGDHPHHKGIWLAVDEINEIKFWAEQGRIENVSVKAIEPQGDPAKLQVVNHWLNLEGEPLLKETTTIGIFPERLFVYDITLTARGATVTFEDTKEGLFGFRMVDSMRERDGGKVLNAEGLEGSAAAWGKTADWIDYYGPVDGKTFGVTLMDHPDNFRRSRYHVRNYGLFSISPFGERSYTGGKSEAAPVVLQDGESLRLRYGLYVHAGDTQEADVPAAYKKFVQYAKEPGGGGPPAAQRN